MITILLIEDEQAIHIAVRAAVPDWNVLVAPDGVIGLDLLRMHQASINLVVLDVAMPYLDGYDTCLRIREIAPELPVLPFTGLVDGHTLEFLNELHCAPPLLKPVEPALLEAALRATINTTPPPLLRSAVRTRAQQTATEREQVGRKARQAHVLVVAQHWRDRHTLKDGVSAAGLRVPLETEHQEVASKYLLSAAGIGGPGGGFLVATTASEASALATFARERELPILALAFTLGEALRLVAQVQEAGEDWPPMGVVVAHPADQTLVPRQIVQAVRRLRSGALALPPLLTAPFAATPLSLKEQAALVLGLQGLTSADIAAHGVSSGSTIRTHFARIREKLGLESDEATLLRWAASWWFEQLEQALSGYDDSLREQALG